MQNFDSESAYALLESYVCLYEHTGDPYWLAASQEAADQFSTWVLSYNYTFPKTSTQGKFGIHPIGAVFANTQNTHGSPGICTHSGIALLKLYRYTQNRAYLELLNDITHVIPQCLVHPSRPIEGVKNGWISERISTTDWYEGIGEIMYGSTWAETSLMLTYIQIPGLYVVPDQGLALSFDNLEARVVDDNAKRIKVEVFNPTDLDAKIRVWVEETASMKSPLDFNFLWNAEEESIKAGEKRVLVFNKR